MKKYIAGIIAVFVAVISIYATSARTDYYFHVDPSGLEFTSQSAWVTVSDATVADCNADIDYCEIKLNSAQVEFGTGPNAGKVRPLQNLDIQVDIPNPVYTFETPL